MYKSKLQELCQKRSWSLPKYSTTKQGLDHNPSFSASVFIHDQSFHTPSFSKSSKEAQNEAARLAFDHFSNPDPNPSPIPNPNPRPPIPTSCSFPQPSLLSCSGSGAISETDGTHAARQTLQHQIQGTCQTPLVGGDNTSTVLVEDRFRDVQHLYKSELQMYAQKRNLVFPVYSCEREGPPHASRFKCRVMIDGKTYESPEYFSTLKEAEHAAAKVALISLSPDCVQKDDSAFYKNLLQELVQKEGSLHLPTYSTSRSGEAHSPVFVSSVEIEGENFIGEEAKTKKQAETSAAKVAYNALKERRSSHVPIIRSSRQEQEAPELLLSCLQSNTYSNLQQHVGPHATIQQDKDHKGAFENFHDGQPNRARTFRQLQWNNTFYVYIPVCIPIAARHEVAVFLKKVARVLPGLYMVNAGCVALSNILWKDDDHHKLNDKVALGKEFHISLGRTVPIQLHHIDSVVAMLRHRLRFQRRYWIEFSKWEAFVNDNCTRTFLSLEVTSTGLVEITNQIQAVNEVYKRHHLPEFYRDPHPHISLAWALGDMKNSLKIVIEDQEKRSGVGGHCIFTSRFNGIECRIGTNTYEICKFVDI